MLHDKMNGQRPTKEIKVVELFAGVGGFHLGLTRASDKYKVIWSNQWEPGPKKQEASQIYTKRFPNTVHSNKDISIVPTDEIPDHNMIVRGFPCQDYSVARTLNQATGIEGKKGVLWWQIHRIIKEKKKKPEFLFLENVDRLLKSPVNQRGRDFAVMLASLSDLGYIVEWRVINAADYGMPQRRRRIFILGYHSSSNLNVEIRRLVNPIEWALKQGTLAYTFNIHSDTFINHNFEIKGDLVEISSNYNIEKPHKSPFENTGIIVDRNVYTIHTKPIFDGKPIHLSDVILKTDHIPENYYLDEESLKQWLYLKKAKKEERTNKTNGFKYNYSEGSMAFPDPLDRPARTIITGEGGSTPSRFKHVIETQEGRMRRLTPVELERLNMFPDNHTEGLSDIKRAFMMGNALVVGVIENIGKTLINYL